MIEDEIRNELESYEIKTTSKMILDRLPKKAPKKRFFTLKYMLPTFTALGASFAALAVVLSLNLDFGGTSEESGTTAIALTSNTLESQLALEVLYAGSMTESTSQAETQLTSFVTRNTASSDEFTKIVDNIDEVYPLLDNIDESYSNFTIYYDSGEYEKLGNTYTYKYIIGDYILYSDEYFIIEDKDEITVESKIALEIADEVYEGTIDIEKETGRKETEYGVTLSYYVSNELVQIEREVETDGDEFEYSYTYTKEGSSSYKRKVSLKEEDGTRKFRYKLVDEENNIYETLKLKETNKGYKIDYAYESSEEEYYAEGIELTIEDGVRTYTLNKYSETRS